MPASESSVRYDMEVPPGGKLELAVPFSAGSHVTVLIMERADPLFDDLVAAANSSTDFWDNPQDDEDWNNA
jgi:hypothetical protein